MCQLLGGISLPGRQEQKVGMGCWPLMHLSDELCSSCTCPVLGEGNCSLQTVLQKRLGVKEKPRGL